MGISKFKWVCHIQQCVWKFVGTSRPSTPFSIYVLRCCMTCCFMQSVILTKKRKSKESTEAKAEAKRLKVWNI